MKLTPTLFCLLLLLLNRSQTEAAEFLGVSPVKVHRHLHSEDDDASLTDEDNVAAFCNDLPMLTNIVNAPEVPEHFSFDVSAIEHAKSVIIALQYALQAPTLSLPVRFSFTTQLGKAGMAVAFRYNKEINRVELRDEDANLVAREAYRELRKLLPQMLSASLWIPSEVADCLIELNFCAMCFMEEAHLGLLSADCASLQRYIALTSRVEKLHDAFKTAESGNWSDRIERFPERACRLLLVYSFQSMCELLALANEPARIAQVLKDSTRVFPSVSEQKLLRLLIWRMTYPINKPLFHTLLSAPLSNEEPPPTPAAQT